MGSHSELSGRDYDDLVKSAAISADTMSPLVGALLGGGVGLAADAIRPADEDEDRTKRRVTSILAGAALGGLAGHGARQFAKASPLIETAEPARPKYVFNPGLSTAIGTAMIATPLALLGRGKYREIAKALAKNKAITMFGRKFTPKAIKALKHRLAIGAAAGSAGTGALLIARNQFRKDASDRMSKSAQIFDAAPKTDRTDTKYGLSKATRDRIYRDTRADMMAEADRARGGFMRWQGFRDPLSGRLRIPVSFGSRKQNVWNSSMTPSQANMVSLLTKNRKIRDYRQLSRAMDKGRSGLEFMGDPSVVNLHSGKLTNHGMDDLKFAFRHVHGRDPTEDDMAKLNARMDRLLGTHAGANGNPHRFEQYLPRSF